ncbi:MAG: hypothetical protein MZV49_12615 [Rhodopseudomonas palustris]|nr:hypothetical protein [Rhodopseudomonas palustris]
MSVIAARREQDVLLTEGQEGTWQWGRPDYNFGNRGNAQLAWPASAGAAGTARCSRSSPVMADNDFTDFDEPVAYSVIGWKGITLVPKYRSATGEFAGEYSYIDFNTNWQACGGDDKDTDCDAVPAQRRHAFLGPRRRLPLAVLAVPGPPDADLRAAGAKYTLDVGNGVDLMARYKYISDEDDRVTEVCAR